MDEMPGIVEDRPTASIIVLLSSSSPLYRISVDVIPSGKYLESWRRKFRENNFY